MDTITDRRTQPCPATAVHQLITVRDTAVHHSTGEKLIHSQPMNPPCAYSYSTTAQYSSAAEKKSKKAQTGGFELKLCLSRIDRSTAEPKGNIFRGFFADIFSKLFILNLV